MSENWERAVQQARGEYVTVLGDDDGLLLHALAEADALIRDTGTMALRWALTFYRWPDVAADLAPSLLYAPLSQGSLWRDGLTTIREVAAGRRHYAELPSVYCSFVSSDVLEALRKRAGRVFCSRTPDVYSGFAIAAEVGRFVSVSRPAAIAGSSMQSNGEAMLRKEKGADVARDYVDLNDRFGFGWHSRAPFVAGSLPALIVEAFEQARDHFPALSRITVDRQQVIQRIIGERATQVGRNPDALTDAMAGVRDWIRDEPELKRWFESNLERLTSAAPPPYETFQLPPLGSFPGALVLDVSDFGVSDTVGVAEMLEKIVHAIGNPTLPPRNSRWTELARAITPPIVLDRLRDLTVKLRKT
jgi:hypothetical protein